MLLAAFLPLALSPGTAPPTKRAPYAYDAGGLRPRGEMPGTFTIIDTQAYIQPGPGGVAIPDTLLIVDPRWRQGQIPLAGTFTVLDTVFEVDGSATDTTLIVRRLH